jgi:hypothetical protein
MSAIARAAEVANASGGAITPAFIWRKTDQTAHYAVKRDWTGGLKKTLADFGPVLRINVYKPIKSVSLAQLGGKV